MILSDTILAYVVISDSLCVKALFLHDNSLLVELFALFELVDDVNDVRGLEGVALTVVVPVAGLELFKRPLVAVEADNDNVLAYAVRDVCSVPYRRSQRR